MYASLISLSVLMVAVVSAAVVPTTTLGNPDFTTCKTQLKNSMAPLNACSFFNSSQTWYIAAYDNTWLQDIMKMDGMNCMNYASSCSSDGSVNTTLNLGMGNPVIINYNKPDANGLWWSQDMQNVLAVIDTDYNNYGVLGGCNNKTGLFWNVLSRGQLPLEGFAWSVIKNKDLMGGPAYNLDDSNSKLTDNSGGCGGNNNGAAQVTAMSGVVVSMLAVMSAWLMA